MQRNPRLGFIHHRFAQQFNLWEQYQTTDVDEHTLINELTLGRKISGIAPYSEKAAEDVARIFRDTGNFAELSSPNKTEISGDLAGHPEEYVGESRQNPQGRSEAAHKPPHTMVEGNLGEEGYFEGLKPLDEGEARLVWPKQLSEECIEDIEYWIEGVLRQIRRRAKKANTTPPIA